MLCSRSLLVDGATWGFLTCLQAPAMKWLHFHLLTMRAVLSCPRLCFLTLSQIQGAHTLTVLRFND
jgi:hypothetical protein